MSWSWKSDKPKSYRCHPYGKQITFKNGNRVKCGVGGKYRKRDGYKARYQGNIYYGYYSPNIRRRKEFKGY